MKKIFCEIAMKSNPGSGAWVFMAYDGNKKLFGNTGKLENETSNRAKILVFLGAIKALKLRDENIEDFQFVTNYQTLSDAINLKWLQTWRGRGWKNASGKQIENQDLWEEVFQQTQDHNINIVWESRSAHRFKFPRKASKVLGKRPPVKQGKN